MRREMTRGLSEGRIMLDRCICSNCAFAIFNITGYNLRDMHATGSPVVFYLVISKQVVVYRLRQVWKVAEKLHEAVSRL